MEPTYLELRHMLFSLLKSEIGDEKISSGTASILLPQQLEALYSLAKEHNLAHIAGQALSNIGLLQKDELSQKFKQASMQAVSQYIRMNHAFTTICQVLEAAQIPFIPLKGSVIRRLYPEPWMRNSCDIDILVQEKDLEQAIAILETELQYMNKGRDYHDVSLFSLNGVHLELHFTLMEESYFPKANQVIGNVWQDARPVREGSSHLQMSDEMFYFYHILHMAKHVIFGGCGIRPFMDIWVLEHRTEFESAKRDQLLKNGGLLTFANIARQLAEVWFSGDAHSAMTRQMEAFILRGGVYGTTQNMVSVQQARRGGKLQYLKFRIFPPSSLMKAHYPQLEKHGWLLPLFYVIRWFRLLSGGRLRRSVRELHASKEDDPESRNLTVDFLEHLGL